MPLNNVVKAYPFIGGVGASHDNACAPDYKTPAGSNNTYIVLVPIVPSPQITYRLHQHNAQKGTSPCIVAYVAEYVHIKGLIPCRCKTVPPLSSRYSSGLPKYTN